MRTGQPVDQGFPRGLVDVVTRGAGACAALVKMVIAERATSGSSRVPARTKMKCRRAHLRLIKELRAATRAESPEHDVPGVGDAHVVRGRAFDREGRCRKSTRSPSLTPLRCTGRDDTTGPRNERCRSAAVPERLAQTTSGDVHGTSLTGSSCTRVRRRCSDVRQPSCSSCGCIGNGLRHDF